jgi:hypothetical protein
MPKNILIFSDGTGQAGGIKFDELRTRMGADASDITSPHLLFRAKLAASLAPDVLKKLIATIFV